MPAGLEASVAPVVTAAVLGAARSPGCVEGVRGVAAVKVAAVQGGRTVVLVAAMVGTREPVALGGTEGGMDLVAVGCWGVGMAEHGHHT